MKGFATVHSGHRVLAFVDLSAGIEERPEITAPELLMGWATPFIDYPWNLGSSDGPTINGTDDQVMGSPVRNRAVTVGLDSSVECSEAIAKLTNSPTGHVPEIPLSKAGVFAADLDLPTEGEVVTGEDRGAGYEAGREGLVVTVAEADNPGIVLIRLAGLHDLHDAEVASSLVAESVALATDGEPGTFELGLDFLEQCVMRQWEPGIGSFGCMHSIEFFPVDELASTMEEHASDRLFTFNDPEWHRLVWMYGLYVHVCFGGLGWGEARTRQSPPLARGQGGLRRQGV